MKQTEKKPADFNFLADKYEKAIISVEKKPFKKLAFMGLSIGIGLFFGMQIIHGAGSAFTSLTTSLEHSHDADRAADKLEVTRLSSLIKKITPEQFSNFLSYVKLQQNIYDNKVSFVTEIVVKADTVCKTEPHCTSALGLGEIESLNNELSKHKKSIENSLTQYQNTYNNIVTDNLKSVTLNDMNNLNSALNSYNANIFMHDLELEKSINEKLFTTNDGNKSYNVKYKILERIKTLDQTMETNVTALKPKM